MFEVVIQISTGMYISLAVMGALGMILIALFIYVKKLDQPKEDHETPSDDSSTKHSNQEKNEGKAEDLLGFRDIDQGVITMENGRSLRAVIRVDALNYHSLSETEQESIDGIMASVLASISFSIQPISITRPVDLNNYIQKIDQDLTQLPEVMQEYAKEHMRYLDEETKQEILIKQDYLVVGVDELENKDEAINELDRRCGLIISGLRRAGHIAYVLDTQAVSDIFYNIFHSNRVINARLKDALGDEYTSFAVSSEKVIKPEFEQDESTTSKYEQQEDKKLVML